jgi:hypothetical protein
MRNSHFYFLCRIFFRSFKRYSKAIPFSWADLENFPETDLKREGLGVSKIPSPIFVIDRIESFDRLSDSRMLEGIVICPFLSCV